MVAKGRATPSRKTERTGIDLKNKSDTEIAFFGDLPDGWLDRLRLDNADLRDELNIAKHHPTFWVRWHGNSGRVSTMGKERVRTLRLLKMALGEKSVPFSNAYDDQRFVMAWSPGEFYTSVRSFNDGLVRIQV